MKWADAPGNVPLNAKATGLSPDSVANVSLIVALDKGQLTERSGKLAHRQLDLVLPALTSCSDDRSYLTFR